MLDWRKDARNVWPTRCASELPPPGATLVGLCSSDGPGRANVPIGDSSTVYVDICHRPVAVCVQTVCR
jgi:hypothetical protein